MDPDTASFKMETPDVRANRQEYSLAGPQSAFIVIIPATVLVAAIMSGNLLLLGYIHVLFGALWTGIDIFMGLVIGRILPKMSVVSRVEIIRRMIPYMLFLMPTLASVTITAGIYLATGEGIFNIHYPVFMAAGVVVLILLVQGLGIFLPNELRIFLELRKDQPDSGKISRLGMINFRLSGLQAAFQVALIFVMANIAASNFYF